MSDQSASSGGSRRRFLGALGLRFPAAAAAGHGVSPPRLDETSPGTDTRERLEEFQGIRVSPSVHITLEERDRFVDAMRHNADHGLPNTG